ncbi:MAG TPA: glycoside hydrolase family 99-like domain-containing protein [Acidimicrobiales bacterium]|nr:glycoside hydrolase family 99-like domain-containing protein [Acidimicrobiales bacterium]
MPTDAGYPVNLPKALAFYLPQFHPIPENDEWWGTGFTEWNNVMRARPLFPGHYQPHVPGELGYYDLRVPEVRAAQAELARTHGISGFVYYHYWFHGRRLLERPFDEVLASGEPDFPFALCWANEEWTRNWDTTGRVLMPQEFSDADDLAHIRWMATAFADDRYIKIDGRPLMLIYRVPQLLNPQRTAEIWRAEAQRLGFPDLYLCWVESWGRPPGGPRKFGMDATVGFMPLQRDEVYLPVEGARGHRFVEYGDAALSEMEGLWTPWKRFPSVMVQWDNTARRSVGATIFHNATPAVYEHWLRYTAASVATVRPEENYLFIVAWNEWAEGNHLEPDQRYGRAFLEATRAVMCNPSPPTVDDVIAQAEARKEEPVDLSFELLHPYAHESAAANAADLVRDFVHGPEQTVVGLGAESAAVARNLTEAGLRYHGIETGALEIQLMRDAGLTATQCDLTDIDALHASLDQTEPVGAFMALDMLEHLAQPHHLLSALSDWAVKHGDPILVVSVPNVAHFDLGLRLLCGQWTPTETGMLDSTHLRFFTAATLEQMMLRCGWATVSRSDYQTVTTDQYDTELNGALPAEMIGALRLLADSINPDDSVQQFVWALKPFAVADPPDTYLEAVGPRDGGAERVASPDREATAEPTDLDTTDGPTSKTESAAAAVRNYLTSAGLIAAEKNRRAQVPAPPVPRWKQRAIAAVYRSKITGRIFRRVYRHLR